LNENCFKKRRLDHIASAYIYVSEINYETKSLPFVTIGLDDINSFIYYIFALRRLENLEIKDSYIPHEKISCRDACLYI
jgi:hypothetical protein